MRKTIFNVLLLAFGAIGSSAAAQGATITLPSVTFTTPASTSITCTETAAANLVVPVAANTVIFSCTVAPSTWTGTVAGSLNAPFAVAGLSGNTFNIVLSTAVTAAATDTPGSVTTSP